MVLLGAIGVSLFQAAAQAPPPPVAVRDPSYARDGRLAASVRGDIWMASSTGSWTRITSGGASDREPAWTPDGSAIVFSSDRSGNFDLWQIRVGPNGAAGEPEQLTRAHDPESNPVVARDGRIIYVRGRGAGGELWVRSTSGAETRLTTERATERWPAISPEGDRVAYVSMAGTARTLRVRDLAAGRDSTIITDARMEQLAWATAGDRITFTASGGRGSVYAVPLSGGTPQVLSTRRAQVAWHPDGKRVLVADIVPPEQVGYNGDPDRLGDRNAVNLFSPGNQLSLIEPATAGSADQGVAVNGPPLPAQADRNADAFDQAWTRTANLYYQGSAAAERRVKWESLRSKYRPRALAAKDDSELKQVIYDLHREHPPYRSSATGKAAVSSAHPVATAAGIEILQKGGNVVDAAVAVSFALGVVEPDASGPGGYGQMLIHRQGMERPALLEFMARVPEDAGLSNTSLVNPGDGPIVAMVPGTVAAMHLAWTRYGSKKVPWADLIAPAIRAARDGYEVSEGLATTLTVERERFMKYPSSRALFFPNGRALRHGDTLRNPDLAWTLEEVAKGGADAFYRGEIAKRLVNDLHAQGNPIKLTDLSRYFAADRDVVSTTYRNYTVYSSAPPVSGGSTLAAQLNLLENFRNPKAYTDDAYTLHAMVSAWQLVPRGSGRLGDPSLWPINTEPFTNKDTARTRWACWDREKITVVAAARPDSASCGRTGPGGAGGAGGAGGTRTATRMIEVAVPPACEAHGYGAPETGDCRAAGTTSFAVGDGDGNMVSVTQTLGTWGGNFYVTPGLGFLYNDKLGSYSTDPNAYGARIPFARHGSTLAPTLVFEGTGTKKRPAMALGAAGNAWITSAVYQALVGMIDQRLDPQAALELPRFNGSGAGFQMEDGYSPAMLKELERIGYRPRAISLPGELRMGYGAAVRIEGGKATAGADPRRAGAAGAIK
jgi:gamma-glutamyltranspeptidase/glutathione hydrolase